MASVLSALGKYEKALGMLEDVARIQKEKYGEKYTGYITTLNNMASLYEDAGNYEQSEKLYEKTAALLKEVVGENHTNYATALGGLAHVKIIGTRYSEAESLLLKALEIQRATVGENHASYVSVLNQLAGLYTLMGNYVLSEDYYLQCMQKYKTIYGDMHPEYSVLLNNLGIFYLESGRYEEAERAIRQSLAIHDFSMGSDHPDRVNMLAGLSNIMLRTGNLKQAEAYALESVKLTREKLGDEHPTHISALLSLGVFYFQSGNYAKAEKIYSEVLEKQRKVTGENSSEFITALNNTGALYLTLCQNSNDEREASEWAMRADSCFRKVLEKDSLLLGTNHPDYAMHLNNLAELYSSTGQFGKSEEYHLKSIEKTIKIFGEHYPELAASWHNLALLYTRTGEYAKAMEYAMKSLLMKQQMYGAGSAAGSEVMPSIAYIYEKQGDPVRAREWYAKAMATQYDLLKKNFAFLSEEEKASYYAMLTHYTDMFAAFATGENSPESSILLYNTLLVNKGILLRSSGKIKKAVAESRDRNLQQTYNEWLGYRQELAKLYSIPAEKRFRNTEELEEKANEVEKILVSEVSSEKTEDIFSADWVSVRNALADNEAAVEFGHYKKLEENNTYSDNYFACVVRKTDASPVLVPLFTAEEMEKLLKQYSGTTAKFISGLYAGNDLYRMIWQPIEPYLSGVAAVYYSPDGLLHKVAFSSLRKTADQFISDQLRLVMLSSTRMLADKKGTYTPGNISVFGGALFSENKQAAGGWPYLEGTLTEALQLKKIFSDAKQQVTIYTGAQASEENVKALTGKSSPRILHIATHGFFYSLPDKKTMEEEQQALVADVAFRGGIRDMEVFQNSPNPLMRSGLILAGANRIWEDTEITGDDGILTAYEVSNLNLSNTQLVVLSACETGLGDIKGSEGVYGLQRAFRIAGAKYMIMSLWQVPDKETAEFMETFYKKLLASKDIRNAFSDTQKEMRNRYDPYYWGAFVLIE